MLVTFYFNEKGLNENLKSLEFFYLNSLVLWFMLPSWVVDGEVGFFKTN